MKPFGAKQRGTTYYSGFKQESGTRKKANPENIA
jgi:hypothetical protein